MRRMGLGWMLVVVVVAAPALASETSKRLVARGLIDLDADREAEALVSFDKAVADDPQDAVAVYYRGITRGHLEGPAAAIADLEQALRLRPEFPRASFELGVALVRSERPAEALPHLQAVANDAELYARAALFAGIAHLKLGELDAARAELRRAAQEPELARAAHYYEAAVEAQSGRPMRARALLEEVVAGGDGPMVEEARELLNEIEPDPRPYSLSASTGFQYDSNVVLAPSDGDLQDDLGISDEADGRATFGLGGRWVPFRSDFGRLQVGYDFSQSLHFKLSEYDIQAHGVGGDLAGAVGPIDGGFYAWYDFHLLDNEKFLARATFLPWLGWQLDDHWRSEVSVRLRRDDFYGDDYGVRDAQQTLSGFRQFYFLTPERFGWVGYRYDWVDSISNDVESKRYQFDAHEFETGLSFDVVPWLRVDAEYSYRAEHYDKASEQPYLGSLQAQPRREDDAHRGQLALRFEALSWLDVVTGVSVTDSASTQNDFQYDRVVAALGLEARY